ncbi:two-component sensor histidine kinase [Paenibacillus sp. 598K]|uniref:sensor histidine kinase n=1 Tax=Paenibacillus sp. 598K TaxID=1117987 RepID=UPI000FF90553|nr:sensor histidine kinase [Paenibacillus sp. 598K]GBF72576.1 two-component sensor histidine kinase [Paenibacillus sp. 598K]
MIRSFLVERRSWLLLLLFIHLLPPLIAAIDVSIPLLPVLYITLLSGLVCLVFLIARYPRETRFYRQLRDWDPSDGTAALAEADHPLARIVEAAISEQAQHYKREAARQGELLEQEKDELLSWIHEVKTPLTAMQLGMERVSDPVVKARLAYEWLRIHHLLDQQLHQRRLPYMDNDLFIERTKLAPIVVQEIQPLRSWCMQKGIGFEMDLQAEYVLTDAKWLGFIIRQLLTNAVKYSDTGDIAVISREANDQVIVEVRDVGRGISAKDLPRIFDRGFTSTSMHQDSAATGMGLYLAHKAALNLHIRIEVESVSSSGSTFRLRFPVANEMSRMGGM